MGTSKKQDCLYMYIHVHVATHFKPAGRTIPATHRSRGMCRTYSVHACAYACTCIIMMKMRRGRKGRIDEEEIITRRHDIRAVDTHIHCIRTCYAAMGISRE